MASLIPPSLLEIIPERYRGAAAIGNSEAEVAQWRLERRRNFPTERAIAQKRQREEDRNARGQLSSVISTGRMGGARAPAVHATTGTAAASATTTAADAAADADAPPEELTSGPPAPAPPTPDDGVGVGDARLGIAPVPPPPGARGAPPSRALCHAFAARGFCRNGSACRYLHAREGSAAALAAAASSAAAAAGAPAGGRIAAPCRWYLLGVCAAGARCPYQHALSGGAGAGGGSGEPQGLLRRLLSSEIQRETSALLQAVRYLVRDGRCGEQDKALPC